MNPPDYGGFGAIKALDQGAPMSQKPPPPVVAKNEQIASLITPDFEAHYAPRTACAPASESDINEDVASLGPTPPPGWGYAEQRARLAQEQRDKTRSRIILITVIVAVVAIAAACAVWWFVR